MIIKGLFSLIIALLNIVFGWVSLPAMPEAVDTAFQTLLSYIEAGIGFVWLIVPREMVLVVVPVILVLSNFDKLYSVVMWVLRKIPFLGIE
ncbi:MAG: hypothetical protein Q4C82_04610 [Eubacteriales bacterium]|nr:hypothetical protein [Eubacteriales bacterium]